MYPNFECGSVGLVGVSVYWIYVFQSSSPNSRIHFLFIYREWYRSLLYKLIKLYPAASIAVHLSYVDFNLYIALQVCIKMLLYLIGNGTNPKKLGEVFVEFAEMLVKLHPW